MSTTFEHLHYRPLLKQEAQRWKAAQAGRSLQRLARQTAVQAPYLTNVLKERAHLSADQLHALGQALDWDEEELDYAQLLLEWERSGNPQRRGSLKKKIDSRRREKLESKANLSKDLVGTDPAEDTRFFLNPFYFLLNFFVGVPRYAREPERIARCLNVQPARVQAWLKDLVKMKIIELGSEGYCPIRRNFHLPRESPLCEPHQQLMQQQSSQHLQGLPEDQKYNFTVTFSADPATQEKIRREFLKFLRAVEPAVKAAPPEEIYAMRFDLFRWSYER